MSSSNNPPAEGASVAAGARALVRAFPPMAVPVISSASLSVYELIRREILSGGLRPGTKLHQAQLAKSFGVSITPVREALSALAADGFVDVVQFTGYVVHAPTLKELDDIYELRAYLAPLMVESAVLNISEEQLDEAEALARSMADDDESEAWAEANRHLHHLLDSSCENKQVASTMRRLADLSRAYVALSMDSSTIRRRRAHDEHLALIELYRRRDTVGATNTTLAHIDGTHRLVREVLDQRAAETPDTQPPPTTT
jgi:DNA-binding GntR family transcriptional regulator